MTPAEAAREVARAADAETAWNYDTIEVTALNKVSEYFGRFAELLEQKEE